jgi:hypothetical protein
MTTHGEHINLMRQLLTEAFADPAVASISYDTFLAQFCVQAEVEKRTAMGYLELLSAEGIIHLPAIQLFSDTRINRGSI